MAEAFIGLCPEGKEVNHKDTNQKNFLVSNLEYLTRKENAEHASHMGLRPCGEKNGSSKLTWKKVQQIRSSYIPYVVTQKQLARRFGVDIQTIDAVLKERNWKVKKEN